MKSHDALDLNPTDPQIRSSPLPTSSSPSGARVIQKRDFRTTPHSAVLAAHKHCAEGPHESAFQMLLGSLGQTLAESCTGYDCFSFELSRLRIAFFP
ncbi:hypothetical protein AOLI_G00023520 [Acnodon oligacanthus]